MTLHPMLPLWLVIVVIAAALLACAVLARQDRTAPGRQRWAWWIRGAAAVVAGMILLGPAYERSELETYTNNVEVYFVVDRTGSMAAQDFDGTQPRLVGVRADITAITTALPGARYSIIAFDSTAASQLPLTSDSRAVAAWANALNQEVTLYSTGSLIDRPLDTLATALERSAANAPDNVRLVFFFSDGENTAPGTPRSFSPVASLISGGAVLGYGTAEGGPMQVNDPTGGQTGYIKDTSQAGSPDAISRIDEASLTGLADQLGVEYVHRSAPGGIEELVADVNLTTLVATGSRTVTTYQYVVWPLAAVMLLFLAWEVIGALYRMNQPVGVVAAPPDSPRGQRSATQPADVGPRVADAAATDAVPHGGASAPSDRRTTR